MAYKDEFAARLRKYMVRAGMRPIDVSRATGINSATMSEYLKGKYVPKQNYLYKLSQALGVTVGMLMGGDEENNNETVGTTPPVYDLLDILFRGEPEFLSKVKSIQIDGKLNEPGVAAKLTETQKETLRNIIKMTYNEAVRNGGKSETVAINE